MHRARLSSAYGIRQLVDVAVKALSPAVNGPYTAVKSIHHLSSGNEMDFASDTSVSYLAPHQRLLGHHRTKRSKTPRTPQSANPLR